MNGECLTCDEAGRHGYCALGRCYCGHAACAAFPSWRELPPIPNDETPVPAPRSSSWDEREEPTWIDQL